MPVIRRIVTHPGGAHKDDLLACCVLVAKHGCPVVRREPTAAELADATVATVDVGGAHDPALNNFDHHHFPREHPPTCALSLVLDALGLYRDAMQFCDWLEPAEWLDSRGPNQAAAWLGVPRRAISQLNSPIDATLLRRFAARPEHAPGETLYEYMRFVGDDLLGFLRMVRDGIDLVGRECERWSVDVGAEVIETIFLPRGEAVPDEPSGSIARYIRAAGLERTIGAMVYPDRRGPGYGISRYEDDPRLDFSQLDGEPDVHFAHKGGFVCKTTATAPARLRELIRGAVVGDRPRS
ncbi:MAG: MYG1 family protein [Planctomycetes bacterium]|nr:MYG1 family protein [Planctomycetota bacterium]